MNSKARPPVIIMGMHRSGTSLLTRMLEGMGIFVGRQKDANHEPHLFVYLNEWLLHIGGGAWDNPAPVYCLLEDEASRRLSVDYIRYVLKTPHVTSFMGWDKYLRYHTPANLDIPWGWKDPRNTFLLPIWLDIFPEAQVVHICRHGVDVASSMKVRRDKILSAATKRHEQRKRFRLYWLRLKRGGFAPGSRGEALEEGLVLWEEYMCEARRHLQRLGARAMEFRYEDLMIDPRRVLNDLAQFTKLQVSEALIQDVARQANRERAYAYQQDPILCTFANQVTERLKTQGY
jgi:hypothetical protein